MIDIKLLERDEGFRAAYRECLKNRKADPSQIDKLMELNSKRKKALTQLETNKAEQNRVSQEIAKLKKSNQDATRLLSEMQTLSQKIKSLDEEAETADQAVTTLIATLPNMTHASVPVGQSEKDNVVLRSVGNPQQFKFKPKDHLDLGEALEIIDVNRAGKVTGSRFSFIRNLGAKLERALINFMLDLHTKEHGYEEILPPLMANEASFFGTGNLPKFKEDLFQIQGLNYFLIPTAEVSVTNFYREEILEESQLPKAFTAFTPCFRSEAGSYGKDVRGIIRQHQFNKVELVRFVHPNNSYEQHELLTKHAEEVLKRLELPYQVASLCTGDISFGAAKCHDINVWLPSANSYKEISSCSNFEDFQARRAQIRFRAKGGKPQFVHTLNGSGLAVGRTLVAILENYQNEDGSVNIPKVLKPFFGGIDKIAANKK